MSAATIVLSVLVVSFALIETEAAAAGSCPLASKVYSCSPKCVQNYDCSHGKICCPNSCNAKSCSEPGAYGGAGGSDKDKYSSGAGSYCDNVKCNSFEVCKMDPSTKRMKCQRA